jgi:hypothetical protein
MKTRSVLSLDGVWNFWLDPTSKLTCETLAVELASPITVPGPWQAQAEAWRDYSGVAWYQRSLEIPAGWLSEPSRAVILGVGAADYSAQVWLNGEPVGAHQGGYLPFELELTPAARAGQNLLTIRVDDSPEHFAEAPHGKQDWYGPLSGLWQPVWLESRPALHIQSVQALSDLDHGCVEALVELSRPTTMGGQVKARLVGPHGGTAAQASIVLTPEARVLRFTLLVADPKPWSPETPNLYQLELDLQAETWDAYTKTIGFRTIEARAGRLFLNGEPLFLRAALDQDYYPDTICTVPSLQFLEDQVQKAKELGLNCLRCHIKVADPRYYEVADRLGMLVWTELPNWSTFTPAAAQSGRETIQGFLHRDGHHPSIIIWTIINEDWGLDLVHDPTHRNWLKDTYRWLKASDPTRLVVDNSACEPNFHIQTDLEDYHYYRQIPDHRQEWDAFVDRFAGRASFTFSPHGEAVRTGKEPLILSEFGNWGLPDIDGLLDREGREPWWSRTGIEWGEGVVYPLGVKDRFRRLGLDKVFGSWKNFVEATQEQEWLALKYQIEAIRRRPEISGYVITEFTDVHWEANGLLDLNRSPKVFHHRLRQVNCDTVILPAWERVAYYAGETVRIEISIGHAAGAALAESTLYWKLEQGNLGGSLSTPRGNPGQVIGAEEIIFEAPTVTAPAVQRLELELVSQDGSSLARNYLDLALYPERSTPQEAPALYTEDHFLAVKLAELGYPVVSALEEAQVYITGEASPEAVGYVREGGRLLLLPDRGQSPRPAPGIPPEVPRPLFPMIRLAAREGTMWDGDWVSTFSWLKRQGPFARLPGGPLVDHSFDRIFPDYLLTGFGDLEYQAYVYAGLVVGWVHRSGALIAERRYGGGKVVVNAFRLEDGALGSDPAATALLDALIELSASGSQ